MKKEETKEIKKKSTTDTKKTNSKNTNKNENKGTKAATKVKKEKEVRKEERTKKEDNEVTKLKEGLKTQEETKEIAPEKKSKLKTSDMILVIGLIIVIILGYFMLKGEKPEVSYELPLTLTGESGLHELSYAEYQEKINNNESFVIIIERATCSHCINYMPVAESFAEDNALPMYYIDTDTFTDEDWTSFEKSNSFLKKNSGKWGTPTTIVLAGSEAVDYIEGETTADNLSDLYDKYFEINE